VTVGHGVADVEPRRRAVRAETRRRLLVALSVTGREAAEIDGLRRALGGSGLGRIAPHITLVPPVNVREDSVVDALRLVRAVAAEDPAEVLIGPAGTFAPRTPVVYLRVGGETARIADLRRRLAAPPLVPVGPREQRPFVPHITIGGRLDKAKIVAAVATLAGFELAATLARVELCQQDEQAPRHPWRVIADVILGSGTTAGRGGREVTFVGSTRLDPETAVWADATPGEDAACDEAPTEAVENPFVLTAYATARPVGAVVGAVAGPTVRIGWLRIDENRRDEGIGRQLVRAAERAAAARGCPRVVFLAEAGGAIEGFLGHLGYTRAALLDPRRDEQPRVAMERFVG
jgi:2'-5' RNA ligase/GNAT superfamily N-acetyltransferase